MTASLLSPFAEAGPALAAMGYSPLPIAPGEKAPGSFAGSWRKMTGWTAFCGAPPTVSQIESWSTWPDAGVGVACGRGLVLVDIDLDEAVEAVRAALPTTPVAKRGAKGLTLCFRGDTSKIKARAFKSVDKVGLCDLLSDGRQSVMPPSRHPSGVAYRWMTARTLGNTPLRDLPEVPDNVAEIIGEALKPFGYAAEPARPERAPTPAGHAPQATGGAITGDLDELNNVALGALSSWVPFLNLSKLTTHGQGYRAVASFRPSGSGKADGARNPNLSFHPSGIVDFGDGGRYRPVGVVEKALGLDWRDAARWLADRIGLRPPEPEAAPFITLVAGASAPSRRGEVAPPEQPQRRPLAVVKAALVAELEHFARRVVPEQRHARMTHESAVVAYQGAIDANARACAGGRLSFNPLPPKPVAPVGWARLAGSETGSGKTTVLEHAIAGAARAGFRLYPVLPRHAVAEQVVTHLRDDRGVTASAYRGRFAQDPEAPGSMMCLAPDVAKLAEAAHLPIDTAVCGSLDGPHCPFFASCGYNRQRQAEPEVWAIQHASLAFPRPAFIPAPDGIAVDETLSVIPGANDAQRLGIDVLVHMGTEIDDNPRGSAILAAMRPRLVAALRNAAEGYLTREALTGAGVNAEGASEARDAEWKRIRPFGMVPGMTDAARATSARAAVEENGPVAAAVALWGEVATFLREGHAVSGRMRIVLDAKTKAASVEWRSLKRIHESWLTGPALFLDATPPGQAYAEAAYGAHIEIAPMLAVEANPHGRVIQVVGAPTSGRALGLGGTLGSEGKLNRARVLRYVRQVAAAHHPRTVVVVGSLKAEAWLRTEALPANVDLGHFYGVSGLDHWRKAAALIQIGRNGVPSLTLEADAGVLTGVPAQALPAGARGVHWHQRVPGAILKVDGSTHVVEREFHPDPAVEALRWRSNEGESLQSLGRLRQIHRDSIEPWEVHILNDQPLPLAVDEVRAWADVVPGACWDLAPDGVLFADSSDIMKAWPEVARKEAREREAANLGPFPYKGPIQGKGPKFLRATFRRKGKREAVAYLLPNGPRSAATFEAWLIAHGFEGVADVVVETRPADRLLVAAVVRSMEDEIAASPSDVWARVEARLGRPATAMERSMLRLAAMREGEQRSVERKPWDDGEGADVPLPADCRVEGEDGEPIGPEDVRRGRAA